MSPNIDILVETLVQRSVAEILARRIDTWDGIARVVVKNLNTIVGTMGQGEMRALISEVIVAALGARLGARPAAGEHETLATLDCVVRSLGQATARRAQEARQRVPEPATGEDVPAKAGTV